MLACVPHKTFWAKIRLIRGLCKTTSASPTVQRYCRRLIPLSPIFTARCTLVQIKRGLAIAYRLSVCRSVCNVGGLWIIIT